MLLKVCRLILYKLLNLVKNRFYYQIGRGKMNDDIRAVFGAKLKQIRTVKKISQEELAFRSGLHRTYISSVERGERNISIINIKKIADALNIEPQDLLS